MSRVANLLVVLATLWLCLGAGDARAQRLGPVQSPILTIDSDRLFADSDYGKRTVKDFEARGAALAAENRRIEEELSAEERSLTDQRPTMAPGNFRDLANAFDEKVQSTRRAQDTKNRELNQALEERRVVFLNAAAPVLEHLMREAGAAVVMERRSVFLSSNAIDITHEAIERLNDALGDGSDAQAE